MKVDVYIEGQRLDLFSDEGINISQNVKDVKDISKIFADFSQTFSVPASKRNNAIFRNYYNADIDGGFDARTRKNGSIDINTLDFKRGKIELESVELNDNEPSMYKITFYGNVINIKDDIGDDKLLTLDWLSNFDHDYSDLVVKDGLTQGLDFTVDGTLYERAIIYPLISYTKQYFYNSNPADTTNTSSLVNISYNASRTAGVDFGDLKPAIKLSTIVEAISVKYGFNFVGGFFESQNYKDLYMNLNNSTSTLNSGFLEFENESGASEPENSSSNDRIAYNCNVVPLAGFTGIGYKIRLTWNGQTIYQDGNFQAGSRNVRGFVESPTSEYNATASVITESDFEFNATTKFTYEVAGIDRQIYFQNSYTNQVIDLRASILDLIYDLKTYDFLTSLFRMFNLVVIADGDNLLVEDLTSWYASGRIFDITRYIDNRKLTVSRGKIFNQFNFSFEDSDQILADQFNRNNRIYYGNLDEKIFTDETQTQQLNGDTLDVEVIFENPIFERLLDTNNNSNISIQYCPYFNRDLKPLTGNPFLFYSNLVDVSSNSIGFNTLSTYTEINTSVFMPSHSREIDNYASFAVNFNAELSEYTYQVMPNNIYSNYYQDFVTDVFSIKRRNFKLEAILPDELLYDLKLNDRLVIADRRYLINSITSNIVERKDNLELINDIYSAPLASDTINNSVWIPASDSFSSNSTSDTTQYIGLANQTPVLLDTGDGTSWITINSFGTGVLNTVNYSITQNIGNTRSAGIRMVDGINNPTYIIVQTGLEAGQFDFSNSDNSALMQTILTAKS